MEVGWKVTVTDVDLFIRYAKVKVYFLVLLPVDVCESDKHPLFQFV